MGEEIRDARRNVPRAILLSLGISTVLYILVGAVAVGLVGSANLAESKSPLTLAIEASGNSLATELVSIGGLVATASVLLTAVLGVSRMAFSMARRKDMPEVLGKVHERFGTPYVSIWIVGVIMALVVLFVDLTGVVAVSTFALLFTYSFANISSFKLKCKDRLYPKFFPVVGLISCLILLTVVFVVTTLAWLTGVAFLAAGTAYYRVRKNHSSK